MSDNKTTVEQMRNLVRQFRKARGWNREKNTKNMAISLVLEATELLEHYQWLSADEVEKDRDRKREVAFELVDVLYWVVTLADVYRIDLSETLHDKLQLAEEKYPEKEFPKGLTDRQVLQRSFLLQKKARNESK